MGTTTSWLIQHSPVPLIVVPKNYRLSPIKEVWYASDLVNIKNELSAVQEFAQLFKAKVHVYHYDYMIELEEVLSNLNKIQSRSGWKRHPLTFSVRDIANSAIKRPKHRTLPSSRK